LADGDADAKNAGMIAGWEIQEVGALAWVHAEMTSEVRETAARLIDTGDFTDCDIDDLSGVIVPPNLGIYKQRLSIYP
jgi:hypothetical protein